MKQYQIVTQHGVVYVQSRIATAAFKGSWTKWTTETKTSYDYDFGEAYTYPRDFWFKWTAWLYIRRQIAAAKKYDARAELRTIGGPYQ